MKYTYKQIYDLDTCLDCGYQVMEYETTPGCCPECEGFEWAPLAAQNEEHQEAA